MRDAGGFLPGKTLPGELRAAMKRLAAYGVTYPEGYDRTLLEKYTKEGVRYPHILMITGRPRITSHFFYPRARKRTGRLLDYGCGTGDNVRQLIRDGFPREEITAFDINRESIDLGFDLYRDREDKEDLFVVAGRSRSGRMCSTPCIPPPSSMSLPMMRSSGTILHMLMQPSGPAGSSSGPRSGWLKGRPGLPVQEGRHGS